MPGQVVKLVDAPCGLFGKTPAAGDFLRLNLAAAVAAALETWTANELARLAGQDRDWTAAFDAAPAWRFVATGGVAGPAPLAGAIGPSRDRVGRAFPCAIVAPLSGLEPQAAVACTPWFDAAEALLERARGGGAGPDALAAELTQLGSPRPDDLDVLSLRGRSTDDGLFLDVRSGPDGRAVTLQAVLETAPIAPGTSLWWRHTGVGAKVLLTPGLPSRTAFAALFRGEADPMAATGAAPGAFSLASG